MSKHIFSKNNIKNSLKTFFLTLLGTVFLSIASGVFLVPFSIVNGGISGIGILLSKTGFLSVDVWSYIIMWSLFLLGLIFLGFKFSASTLIATLFYPIFLTILLRTNLAEGIVKLLLVDGMSIDNSGGTLTVTNMELMDVGRLIIIALTGGALTGIGCGITFNAGGSTGGVDVLVFIINKFTNIKTSVLSLIVDGLIIFAGILVSIFGHNSQGLYSGLVGILSAAACSVMIEVIYNSGSGVVLDINTIKYKEINDYIINELGRSSTIYDAIGGYSKINKKVIRVVIRPREFIKIKDEIADIDPSAFIICYQAKQVSGDGWSPLVSTRENTITQIEHNLKKNNKGKKIDDK